MNLANVKSNQEDRHLVGAGWVKQAELREARSAEITASTLEGGALGRRGGINAMTAYPFRQFQLLTFCNCCGLAPGARRILARTNGTLPLRQRPYQLRKHSVFAAFPLSISLHLPVRPSIPPSEHAHLLPSYPPTHK